MGDMIRCPKCATHHYRNDPCPNDDTPRRVKRAQMERYDSSIVAAVPKRLVDGVTRYVEYGILPGSFLRAVLSNDLMGAVRRADPESLASLPALCCWIYNAVPRHVYGSIEAMERTFATHMLDERQTELSE